METRRSAEIHELQRARSRPAPDEACATIMATGRAAIAGEARALATMAETLDERFADAVLALAVTRGRVVVTGLGKSGHIARKVAATFTATGLPALFVHAGEASHGDLGALMAGDTLLVLSNSGETRECVAIAKRAAALDCTVIVLTARTGSALAGAADLLVALPAVSEVCPFDVSPTTSTTMMLAMGDALAVATMRRRGVSREALRQLHPGGGLGRGLVPVASFMHRGGDLPLVEPGTPMREVLAVISAKGFGIAAVADQRGTLLGIITDGDIRRHAAMLDDADAAAVMTRGPRTVSAGAIARDALALLARYRITALMVVEDEASARVAGLVHIHDILALGVP